MPIYAIKSVFAAQRTIPAILTQPVTDSEFLVYDGESGVFTNQSLASAITVDNTGTGSPLGSVAGNTISIKSLSGGSNISLTDDGFTVTINNDSTAVVANIAALNNLSGSSDIGRSALVLDTGDGQPGFYVWNGSWINPVASMAGATAVVHVNFTYTSPNPLPITTLPPSAVILTTQIAISTDFNGSPSSMTIGTPSENDMLMTASEVDMTQVKSFIDDTYFILPSSGNQQINAYITPNGATQGAGTIFIMYSLS